MNIVTLKRKANAPKSIASLEPLFSLPKTVRMQDRGRFYIPLRPNNNRAHVGVLKTNLHRYYTIT